MSLVFIAGSSWVGTSLLGDLRLCVCVASCGSRVSDENLETFVFTQCSGQMSRLSSVQVQRNVFIYIDAVSLSGCTSIRK